MNALLLVTILLGAAMPANVTMTTDEMLKIVKDDFLKADTNKNGRLEGNEFMAYYNKIDADGDHHLKEDEFMTMTGDDQAHADFLYKYFDVNNDGDITPEDVKKVFTRYDANSDGSVSYHEFMLKEEAMLKMMVSMNLSPQ